MVADVFLCFRDDSFDMRIQVVDNLSALKLCQKGSNNDKYTHLKGDDFTKI